MNCRTLPFAVTTDVYFSVPRRFIGNIGHLLRHLSYLSYLSYRTCALPVRVFVYV